MRSLLLRLIPVVIALVIGWLGFAINPGGMKDFVAEGHFLEMFTVVLYVALGAYLIYKGTTDLKMAWWAAPLPLLAAFRELDLNKGLPTDNMDKAEFWSSSSVAMGWKIMGPILLFGLLAYVVMTMKKLWPRLTQNRRQGGCIAYCIDSALLLYVASVVMDKLWGPTHTGAIRDLGFVWEEWLEIGPPILLLIAAWIWHPPVRRQ